MSGAAPLQLRHCTRLNEVVPLWVKREQFCARLAELQAALKVAWMVLWCGVQQRCFVAGLRTAHTIRYSMQLDVIGGDDAPTQDLRRWSKASQQGALAEQRPERTGPSA
jgi:hypothetical protein